MRSEAPAGGGTPSAPRHGGTLPERVDTVVVGAGLAGLELADVLARRSAEAGATRDILLLEAGDATEPRHVNIAHPPATAQRMWLRAETDPSFHRPYTSLTPPHYTGASGVRQRLGGRALYWYGVILPVEDWALRDERWPRAVVSDLTASWRGGAPLYQRLTERLRQWTEQESPDGGAPLSPPPETTVAGLRLRPTPLACRVGPKPESWWAYSALDAWRDPVTGEWRGAPPGVQVRTGVRVLDVVVRDGRARGVVVTGPDGSSRQVAAERVVLCAGTLENSRLALQALGPTGPTDGDAPRLPGLVDHLVQGVYLRLTGHSAHALRQAVSPGSYYVPYGPPVRSNLFVDVTQGPDEVVELHLRTMGEQLDEDSSWVSCTPGPDRPWPVSVHATLSAADRRLLDAQRQVLRESYRRLTEVLELPATPLSFPDYDAPTPGNDVVLPEHSAELPPNTPTTWSNLLGTEDHEGGTLPLGGVLDEHGEFRAVAGLFAAGPSTFPRLGAANPSLTTLALVHRLAAHLVDDSRESLS